MESVDEVQSKRSVYVVFLRSRCLESGILKKIFQVSVTAVCHVFCLSDSN